MPFRNESSLKPEWLSFFLRQKGTEYTESSAFYKTKLYSIINNVDCSVYARTVTTISGEDGI